MPYDSIGDLPASVRSHLPLHAQEIYLSAFNSAWRSYHGWQDLEREVRAHRIAWAAVKRRYRKADDHWVATCEVKLP